MNNVIEDYLGRKSFVEKVMKIIENSRQKISFSISGEWGCGKSFFINMLEEEINNRLSDEEKENKYILIKYNCWEKDYYDEPLMAIISDMNEWLNSNIEKKVLKEVLNTFMSFLKTISKIVPASPSKILVETLEENEKARKKKEYNYNDKFDKMINTIKEGIKKLPKDYKIVFIIDELDRCLPAYAIKVLERVHHVFDSANNAVLIFTIDKSQLEETIRNIYGKNVKTNQYLRKFIDFELCLDKGTDVPLIEKVCSEYYALFQSNGNSNQTIKDIEKILNTNMPIRDIIKLYEKACTIHKLVWEEKAEQVIMAAEIIYLTFEYSDIDIQYIINSNYGYPNKTEVGHDFISYFNDIKYPIAGDYKVLKGFCSSVLWLLISILESTTTTFNGHPVRKKYCYCSNEVTNEMIKKFSDFVLFCSIIK